MKHISLISLILMTLAIGFASETKCSAQSDMLWRVGGQFGVLGSTFSDKLTDLTFTMSLSLGFDIAIKNTPWRWGAEAGIMNQGMLDYHFPEDQADKFVRPNFVYIGPIAEYVFKTWELPRVCCRAGLAYSRQSDLWVNHVEHKSIPLGITGVGFDFNYFKFMLNGYIAPGGIFVFTLSGGLYFGQKKKN